MPKKGGRGWRLYEASHEEGRGLGAGRALRVGLGQQQLDPCGPERNRRHAHTASRRTDRGGGAGRERERERERCGRAAVSHAGGGVGEAAPTVMAAAMGGADSFGICKGRDGSVTEQNRFDGCLGLPERRRNERELDLARRVDVRVEQGWLEEARRRLARVVGREPAMHRYAPSTGMQVVSQSGTSCNAEERREAQGWMVSVATSLPGTRPGAARSRREAAAPCPTAEGWPSSARARVHPADRRFSERGQGALPFPRSFPPGHFHQAP